MVAGATANEWALVAFLLGVVLLATKISWLGETIGGLFATRSPAGGEQAHEESAADQDEHSQG